MLLLLLTVYFCTSPVWAAEKPPLRVASSFTSPPLAFLRKGSPAGLEVEILHHIANQIGREIQWVFHNTPADRLEEDYDVALGFCHPPTNGQYIPYYTTCWALLCIEAKIPNETELWTQPWALLDNLTPPKELTDPGALYPSAQGLLPPLVDLTQGKIPGWLHPLPSLLYLRFAAPEVECVVLRDLPYDLVVWVSMEAYSSIHNALQELRNNGILDTLAARWFTYDGQPKIHSFLTTNNYPICDLSRSSL